MFLFIFHSEMLSFISPQFCIGRLFLTTSLSRLCFGIFDNFFAGLFGMVDGLFGVDARMSYKPLPISFGLRKASAGI